MWSKSRTRSRCGGPSDVGCTPPQGYITGKHRDTAASCIASINLELCDWPEWLDRLRNSHSRPLGQDFRIVWRNQSINHGRINSVVRRFVSSCAGKDDRRERARLLHNILCNKSSTPATLQLPQRANQGSLLRTHYPKELPRRQAWHHRPQRYPISLRNRTW